MSKVNWTVRSLSELSKLQSLAFLLKRSIVESRKSEMLPSSTCIHAVPDSFSLN